LQQATHRTQHAVCSDWNVKHIDRYETDRTRYWLCIKRRSLGMLHPVMFSRRQTGAAPARPLSASCLPFLYYN
jgi:hypothetical protein